MVQAPSAALTVHDYMAMPEGPPYYQLVEGELIMSPSPHWRHQKISRRIQGVIDRYLLEHDIGELFSAPMDVILNQRNVYQPDVLFFRYKGKAKLGKRCIEGAPDFVVEILSESTAHLDTQRKLRIYAQSGVNELWFVDPEARQVIVFNLGKSADQPQATYSGKDAFASPTFPGLTFSCAEIFRGVE
jgi:Uma2 family endonuclease